MFGYSVALNADGNTLAVGVYDEDGSARTINGPVDNMRQRIGRRVRLHANRQHMVAAGVHQDVERRGRRFLRRRRRAQRRRQHAAMGSIDEDCIAPASNARRGMRQRPEGGRLAGAALVFVRSGTTWSQQAYIKASNTGQNDWFGSRLALSGDGNTLAVGAQNEDSAAKGINGNQKDESAEEAGAVYLFARTGTTWTQQAYIKGSNTEAYDEFGGSVALSRDGRTLVVGARGEDSGAPRRQTATRPTTRSMRPAPSTSSGSPGSPAGLGVEAGLQTRLQLSNRYAVSLEVTAISPDGPNATPMKPLPATRSSGSPSRSFRRYKPLRPASASTT